MPLTDEQARAIKEQLLKQITQLPQEQQAQATQYIQSMNNQQLEEFLRKNQMMQEQQKAPTSTNKTQPKSKKLTKTEKEKQQCVFCALSKKTMPSIALYEDKDHLAILEIKPFSQGHTIVIPKKHIKKTKSLPSKSFTLANMIGKHITKKLKALSFQVTTTAEMNHAIINIIPIYKKQPLTYERHETKQEDLQKIAIRIGVIKKRKAPKKKKAKSQKSTITNASEQIKNSIIQLPRRIP